MIRAIVRPPANNLDPSTHRSLEPMSRPFSGGFSSQPLSPMRSRDFVPNMRFALAAFEHKACITDGNASRLVDNDPLSQNHAFQIPDNSHLYVSPFLQVSGTFRTCRTEIPSGSLIHMCAALRSDSLKGRRIRREVSAHYFLRTSLKEAKHAPARILSELHKRPISGGFSNSPPTRLTS